MFSSIEFEAHCLSPVPQAEKEKQEPRGQIAAQKARRAFPKRVKAINTALVLAYFFRAKNVKAAVDLRRQ